MYTAFFLLYKIKSFKKCRWTLFSVCYWAQEDTFLKSRRKAARHLGNMDKTVLTWRGWMLLLDRQVGISTYMWGAHSRDWYIPTKNKQNSPRVYYNSKWKFHFLKYHILLFENLIEYIMIIFSPAVPPGGSFLPDPPCSFPFLLNFVSFFFLLRHLSM